MIDKITAVLYSKPGCQACRITKGLAKFDYINSDVDANPEYKDDVRRLGYQQLPVVAMYVNGVMADSWSGLAPDKIAYWNEQV